MLSVFPSLLSYQFFAVTLIRVAAGLVCLYLAYRLAAERRDIERERLPVLGHSPAWVNVLYALAVFATALFLIIGLYTQAAAIAGMLIALEHAFLAKNYRRVIPLSRAANLLLFVMCLSLLFSGAGAFAFDLPL